MSDGWAGSFQYGVQRPDVACPRCGYVPVTGESWRCSPDGCGALFDTFETHAKCPRCDATFSWTACPACGKISAHRAWYLGAAKSG